MKPPLPTAAIVGYHQDEAGDWVAELDCGHAQHVRHRPPWQRREWVTTEAGRAERIGQRLGCPFCRMPALPATVREYKRTAAFDADSTPAGLTKSHRLKAGVWGEIVVTAGRVLYVFEDEEDMSFVLGPNVVGVVAPERPHHVTPEPGACFYVRFLRDDG